MQDAPFDLQFAADDRARRNSPGLTDIDYDSPGTSDWLDAAARDIEDPTAVALRTFLREAGAELEGTRALYVPLCQLHGCVQSLPMRPDAVRTAITLLQGPLKELRAPDVRARVLDGVAFGMPHLGDSELEFALTNIGTLDSTRRLAASERLAGTLWAHDPARVMRLLGAVEPQLRELGERGIRLAATGDLIAGLQKESGLLQAVLEQRPDLVRDRLGWRSGLLTADSLGFLNSHAEYREEVRDAVLEAPWESLSGPACRVFGKEALIGAIVRRLDEHGADSPSDNDLGWFRATVRMDALAKLLSDEQVKKRRTLEVIARAVGPDDIPNDYGTDPCVTAARQAKGPVDEAGNLFLACWLFARGLGWRTRNRVDLISMAVGDVYVACVRSQLRNESWSLIEHRLPDSFFGGWSKEKRIREAVLNIVMEREWAPARFAVLDVPDDVFQCLVHEAGLRGAGRSFLSGVRQTLVESGRVRYGRRLDLLDTLFYG